MAQCGYPVTLHTNKDYCVGSSLIATSTHAMQRITWYQNGQPVGTTTGVQSLSTRITRLPIFSHTGIFGIGNDYERICTDDAGNIYVLYDDDKILKVSPTGVLTQVVDFFETGTDLQVTGMTVDPAGNIYVADYANTNLTGITTLVYKIPAGTVSAEPSDLLTAVPVGAVPVASLPITADYVDCQNNLYLFCSNPGAVYRYTPGAAAATYLATGVPVGTGCELFNGIGAIYADAAGTVFFQDAGGVKKITPGMSGPVTVVPNTCPPPINSRILGSFWVDGGDTVYQCIEDGQNEMGYVEKWAPGASSGQRIISFLFPSQSWGGQMPITMDTHGDILMADAGDSVLYEFKRTTSIDSVFTPTDTGTYYAVVTDIRGYTATSDTFHVNAPSSGPPSIQISATATSTPVCTPITFTAQTTNAGQNPFFQWQVSGVPAGGDSTSYSYNLFANGDEVYCIMTAQAGCAGPVQDTSNVIQLSIDPQGAASVTIATPKDPICSGDTAAFEATITNGSTAPTYEWLLNGVNTGDDSAGYSRSNFSKGDVVTCLITSDDACGLAKSNSISLAVSTRPTVESGEIFTILHGHSLTLTPVITGDVSSYLWTPATGLSDPTIADPVADPATNTLYTLTVTAPGGCSDNGTILVNVYTPLSIPGAFTPNGDGHNDIFYVLGGPVNSQVEDFAVYDRYGAEVFHAHDVAPGDATHGWNGYFHGSLAPLGTYVYSVLMKFADGSRQVYKGTVILIR